MYKLIRQLEYKSDWNDRTYHKVDRYFASSQICSNCGYKMEM
ncbi:zinc ribbon domain-containing protein [Anaerosalibacter massiliensis]|uniref:Transposase n=1 Tax=Anaerosalibacter massiliensis TaxID=1347392 RepID=A0A9X2S3R2_9FIRM|nr:zinc ribbon domain-containing protein [Anaerosalibacter massiliensis]MCR2043035.1 transposase [Anaerosalibacter massiliensis]